MEVQDLLGALERLLSRRAKNLAHQVSIERLSLRDGIESVVEHLRLRQRCRFEDLFPESASRVRIIVTFLAILELVKSGAVTATQSETHAEIEILLLRDVNPDDVLSMEDVEEMQA